MAIPTIKATYSLDVETVKQLEVLAKRWHVSKSAALRRAISAASRQARDDVSAVAVLDRVQAALALSEQDADAWSEQVTAERHASNERLDADGE